MRFGEFFKEKRIATGKTLRAFCVDSELDPGNISRLERGLLPAPQKREILEHYAGLLGIKKGTDDWYQFFDLAAAEAGRIPDDLLSDAQVVERLPVFFRTIRGQKLPDDKLDDLVRLIREG